MCQNRNLYKKKVRILLQRMGIKSNNKDIFRTDRYHYNTAKTVVLLIDGLVQDCSNSIANALELLQSCTKPSI